jgi:hypothetical protein
MSSLTYFIVLCSPLHFINNAGHSLFLLVRISNAEGNPSAVINLLPCDHEVIGREYWKQPLVEIQVKIAYIRPKVIRSFPRPYISGSDIHLAAFF